MSGGLLMYQTSDETCRSYVRQSFRSIEDWAGQRLPSPSPQPPPSIRQPSSSRRTSFLPVAAATLPNPYIPPWIKIAAPASAIPRPTGCNEVPPRIRRDPRAETTRARRDLRAVTTMTSRSYNGDELVLTQETLEDDDRCSPASGAPTGTRQQERREFFDQPLAYMVGMNDNQKKETTEELRKAKNSFAQKRSREAQKDVQNATEV